MQHRRPHLSKKAKPLVATTVALAAAAGITVAQADESSKKCSRRSPGARQVLRHRLGREPQGVQPRCAHLVALPTAPYDRTVTGRIHPRQGVRVR
ncbi:hypothetical protein [Streptomyces sp. A30]|uniref:hypothetical protein n=1 Tax=Streptomyces sp. A30 TaxID=2789273 RepID=UPI00398083FF